MNGTDTQWDWRTWLSIIAAGIATVALFIALYHYHNGAGKVHVG